MFTRSDCNGMIGTDLDDPCTDDGESRPKHNDTRREPICSGS